MSQDLEWLAVGVVALLAVGLCIDSLIDWWSRRRKRGGA
jgi:hypothetical protein